MCFREPIGDDQHEVCATGMCSRGFDGVAIVAEKRLGTAKREYRH
jgi:hypothetical protein